MTTELSVIIATWNRLPLLRRLLAKLDEQTLDPQRFEVVVVDDGSREDTAAAIRNDKHAYRLVAIRQQNAGPAAARNRAILNARGRLCVIVDDDMKVEPTFLAEHLAMHPEGTRRAVLGRLAPDEKIADMPYFERWYARGHERTAERAREGTLHLDGYAFYTGNVSFLRADYLAVGGFDLSMRIGEDTDLGLRLERSGVELAYCPGAVAYHGSDHTSEERWLQKARQYGVIFHKIGRKHLGQPKATPMRYLFEMNPLARPLVGASLLAPELTQPVTSFGLKVTKKLWGWGLDLVAQPATSLLYTMEFMRGVRSQTGSLFATARAIFTAGMQRVPAMRGLLT